MSRGGNKRSGTMPGNRKVVRACGRERVQFGPIGEIMTNLRDNVKAFHDAMNMDDLARPGVPSEDVVRLRARLITEEYFETMRARCFAVTQKPMTS